MIESVEQKQTEGRPPSWTRSSRFPRFKRADAVIPMTLTERDCEVIRLVNRHRFLRSWQIIALVAGSRQQLLRRLKSLYHHGFLERPRSQLNYFHKGGSHHMIYGLGKKGAAILHERGLPPRPHERERAVGGVFLDHALLVSDIMVAIELACRKHGHIRLLYEDELPLPDRIRTKSHPFEWVVKVNGRKLYVVPDRTFALDINGNRVFFFLEADRGTMPITRKNIQQTSFSRKLVAYEATWNQNIHRARLGFNRFRVLTVTEIAGRVKSLVGACSELKSGHGLFLFADKSILSGDILSGHWLTGRGGKTDQLLN
jgi:Replication-relaxation